jgi:endonuclease/exonuclease/phosphatase family metal-dependent hydrolase
MLRLDRIYATRSGTIMKAWTDKEAGRCSDHLPVFADIAFEAKCEKGETQKVE